jgi:L-rhamnose mutarotase
MTDREPDVQRVAFIQWVKPGARDAYTDAHRPENIWPDIVRATQDAGARNYTGFIGGPDGRLVVGYFETPDLDGMMRELASREVNTRWAARMTPLLDSGGDLSNGSMEFLTPIWRID